MRTDFFRFDFKNAAKACLISGLLGIGAASHAGNVYVPNRSFELLPVPDASPYASPVLDSWEKSPQPAWYDPSQNYNTPWSYLMGEFYNDVNDGAYIDNCDGNQCAFIFAVPGTAIFQDYNSFSEYQPGPTHAFNAQFNVGRSYDLTVGVIGGGGGMNPGATLELSLYYLDASNQPVTVAATTITNSAALFPTNTHFVDFHLHVPTVHAGDAWAGKNIGIQIASTVGFDIAGGYWDVDNVRLTEGIDIPNFSFELPPVPDASPYASPAIAEWQKSAQPYWYDPAQNFNTPWSYLMGEFYNDVNDGAYIDNCDGNQCAFLFAVPDAALFQDNNTQSEIQPIPSHAFDAKFTPGKSYRLSAGVIGGGGGMYPGATLELSLYYRDAASNIVTVAATTITNDAVAFPTNTHFVDYSLVVPAVRLDAPWAGKNIGVRLASTVGFDIAGGYWDLDNVRLAEFTAPLLQNVSAANGQFTFSFQSEPEFRFELLSSTDVAAPSVNWVSLGSFTNATGTMTITNSLTSSQQYFRVRPL
jgi:hypothetical protein